MTDEVEFDAIVIGSGVSGGWAAKELTEKGLKTLMLDRGRMVEHSTGYVTEGRAAYENPWRDQMPKGVLERDFPVQDYWVNWTNHHLFNNDRLNTYTLDDERPFKWIRSGVFGGRSLLWGRQSYRWAPIDFEANAVDGHGIPWPVGYDDIAPWYSYVEQFVGISGEALGLPQLPDSEFQPPMPLNVAERHLRDVVARDFDGRVLTIGRTSNMTEDKIEQGRTRCQYRNQCTRGCSYGAYFSTQSTTLPAADATGNLTMLADAVVASLEYDPETQRVTGVRVVDAETKEGRVYRSRIVFLCASSVASTQILLNSRSEANPTGLGNRRSDALGRYMMDHIFGCGAEGVLPDMFLDKVEYGRRPNGFYIPRYRNLSGGDEGAGFVRGYGFQGAARRMDPQNTDGFGASFKENMRVPGPWKIAMSGFGEVLPYADNRMMLDETTNDRFGIPHVKFDVAWRENELAMVRDYVDQAVRMLEAAGCVDITTRTEPQPPGAGIHEMGTARMGDDPTQSVVNRWNQVHDAPNVFVTDGAAMTSASCVNPSLTYMAFTARAADHAVQLLQEGAI